MSMIEKQIEELRDFKKDICESKCIDITTARYIIDDAIKTIQRLSAKLSASNLNNGWIKCSDALPEQPKENPLFENKPLELYLVSLKGQPYAFRAFWNGKFFTDGWGKVDATAWQPLPEPYEHDT